jgi:hypothetical protein
MLDGPSSVKTPAQGGTASPQSEDHPGVMGNERLTALAGALLLVLIVAELVTTPNLHALLSAHIFVGLLLAGPLAVKLGSVGYRFLRYYAKDPVYRRKGPPRLALRVLAPFLLATTLVLIGSGIGLLVTGPIQPGPMLALHALSAVIWLPVIAIHVFGYIRREPRLIAADWRGHPAEQARGRGLRLGLNLGVLLVVLIAAFLLNPLATPWLTWIKAMNEAEGRSFTIVGTSAAVLALLIARPLRWR